MKNLFPLYLVLMCALLSSCGSESESSKSQVDKQATSKQSSSDKNITNLVSKQKPWSGSAAGYVHTRRTDNDRIELFIVLGKLLATAYVYNNRAGELRSTRNPHADTVASVHADISGLFSPSLLALYKSVDPIVQAHAVKNNLPIDIDMPLVALTNPQQISDIMNGGNDSASRDIQYAANQKLHLLSSRIGDAVLMMFPSRHEYLLASSALIREAGDKVATAVDANGIVKNTKLVEEARALIYQLRKLNPKNITYCDSQRLPLRALKDGASNLLDNMLPNRLGQKFTVTATDVYSLASQTQKAGKGFPAIDSNKCE